ncbi:MAG: SMP-30/gluconolactonase/LRE family protein [Mycobacterium sp.]
MAKEWDFELVAGPVGGTTEGPAWDGRALLFSNIAQDRILRYDPVTGETTVKFSDTNRNNGNMIDSRGNFFGCRAGDHCIALYKPDGTVVMLPNRLDGKRHNRPNDLAIDRFGRIWFTDSAGRGLDPNEFELDHQSVLRLDPDPDAEGGYTLKRMTFDTDFPNGILLSKDERTLYVAQSGYSLEVRRELRAYPLRDDDTLGDYRTLFTFGQDKLNRDRGVYGVHRGIDGMVLTTDGNIIACTGWREAGPGPMIYVFSPTGRVLETHPVPVDRPTNITFGGPDLSDLYITSSGYRDETGGCLFRVRNSGHRGWLPYGEVLGTSEPRG